jgi:hypothetical protein
MAFQPGHKKHGGRKKGTANKNKCDAQMLAAQLGIDPLKVLLFFCNGDWEKLGIDARKLSDKDKAFFKINGAREALQYIIPKKKAVEHSGPGGEPLQAPAVEVHLSPEQQVKIAQAILDANSK